jgi:hypothetical protein
LSLRFLRRLSFAAPAAILIALTLAPTARARGRRGAPEAPRGRTVSELPAAADDSSLAAQEWLMLLRSGYGGVDNWASLDGLRYYVTYRIPGPDGKTASEWTEAHLAWLHDRPRLRIDNATDSTVVIVTGDTTYVRRDGVWTSDPRATEAERAHAIVSLWLVRMPWNLLDFRLKRRLDPPFVKGEPLSVRVEYGPDQDLPAGTRAWVRFDPPSYALRNVRWYDPRMKAWYLLELEDDHNRYGWTWSERRTLRSSDAEGKRGPVILTATIEDMQLDNAMPIVVLAPPR